MDINNQPNQASDSENSIGNNSVMGNDEIIGESPALYDVETDSPISHTQGIFDEDEDNEIDAILKDVEKIAAGFTVTRKTEEHGVYEQVTDMTAEEDEEEYYDDAEEPSEEIEEEAPKGIISEVFDWVSLVAFSLSVVVVLFSFVFRIVTVDGTSMNDTLAHEDRIIIANFMYKPAKGDIIVFRPTSKAYAETPFVKRVIGVAGDVIDIDKETHEVYVNGTVIDEPYIKGITLDIGRQNYPITIPEGYLFVMGDNRQNSTDSRFTSVGLADERSVLGKGIVRIWPISDFKFLG